MIMNSIWQLATNTFLTLPEGDATDEATAVLLFPTLLVSTGALSPELLDGEPRPKQQK